MNSIVNCVTYADGRRVSSIELKDISDALEKENQFVWLGLKEPTEEILKEIQIEFGLHELAIEDAHRAHQRPKIESYGDIYFIVLRTIHMNEKDIQPVFGETHFFLGKNFLITIRHGSSLAYSGVRERCESTPHLLKKGPGFVLYAVMDFIVDQYFPVIEILEQELDDLEDKIFAEDRKSVV